jgi:hypothetical protein
MYLCFVKGLKNGEVVKNIEVDWWNAGKIESEYPFREVVFAGELDFHLAVSVAVPCCNRCCCCCCCWSFVVCNSAATPCCARTVAVMRPLRRPSFVARRTWCSGAPTAANPYLLLLLLLK